jgi:predicted TPR repeat methyltransferase
MGNTLQDQGKLEEAIEAYNKALAIKPDYASAQHMVSSLTGKTTTSTPKQYVESLFDGYAKKFEQSLVENLEYKIPKMLTDIVVKENGGGLLGSVLDLGCGTGLMGVEIKDYCSNLEGIDLSEKMLGLADAKKVYDKLIHTDILHYLADTDLCFDYFIATDVLIYVGDLTELFRLIKSRNKRKGKLVFSTEHTELDGFQLEKTGRYSHSKTYIEELCAKFKYTISHFSMVNLRKDKGQFLTGGLYILDF